MRRFKSDELFGTCIRNQKYHPPGKLELPNLVYVNIRLQEFETTDKVLVGLPRNFGSDGPGYGSQRLSPPELTLPLKQKVCSRAPYHYDNRTPGVKLLVTPYLIS